MNRDDQFEKVLQRQTIKPLPSAWRDEILDAAISASARSSRGNEALKISNLFWPNPKAWAGLAAVWALILGLNLANRETADPRLARRDAPPSPLVRELLQQQERLFAELVGPLEPPEATPPKRLGPGPRSSREQNLLPERFSSTRQDPMFTKSSSAPTVCQIVLLPAGRNDSLGAHAFVSLKPLVRGPRGAFLEGALPYETVMHIERCQMVPPLPGERAGVRANVLSNCRWVNTV